MKNKKEILDFIGVASYQDYLGTYIWANRPDGTRDIVGVVYGYNTDTEKNEGKEVAELFQDELGIFIAEAINEKVKKELDNIKAEYIPPPQRIYVSDIDISCRLYGCLRSCDFGLGINFLDELSFFTRKEVLNLRNLGKKSFFTLEKYMKMYDVKFKGE
jgi:DNA-directed RNA polymerase alpha subunit